MSRLRLTFWVMLSGLLLAAGTATAIRLGTAAATNKPLDVPPGDAEIAYFHTATNASTWERFVAGIQYAARQQPNLRVDAGGAFLDQTTAVPEVVVTRDGSKQRLLIRWYKQSAQMRVEDWVRELAKRERPPLAVAGGGSSDRALELARVLAAQKAWRGAPPLLLITTATASKLEAKDEGGTFAPFDLMRVYPERTFRFCFTNRQMARAVIDFVWSRPDLRPQASPAAGLGLLAAGPSAWTAIAPAALADAERGQAFSVQWGDDPYSGDLARNFRQVLFDEGDDDDAGRPRPWLHRVGPQPPLLIGSSVGGYLRPNPQEAAAVQTLVSGGALVHAPIPRLPLQRSLLILPTVPPPARRVVGALTGTHPELGRQLVAVSGDGISFNHVFRDGSLVWNARLVPVPLVFFTHQNPVNWDAREEEGKYCLRPDNATDDVLHFADVVRIVAEAAFDLPPVGGGAGLPADADELARRIRWRDPSYFDADGNRRGGRGEYVVLLRPRPAAESPVPSATLEVWTDEDGTGWRPVGRSLDVQYR